VTFTATGACDWYLWRFGDGEESETHESTVTHRFRGAMVDSETHQPVTKQYTVKLTMEDKDRDPIYTGEVSVAVEPLEKTLPIQKDIYYTEVTVLYNWVGDTNGEDTYIVSRVYALSWGVNGVMLPSVTRGDATIIWQDTLIVMGAPDEFYIHSFVPETTLVFPDGVFVGIEVRASDKMTLLVRGLGLGSIGMPPKPPPILRYEASTAFSPDAPIETPTPLLIRLLDRIVDVIKKFSPGELRAYDQEGFVTGLVDGNVKEEIPNSAYFNGTVIIVSPNASYRYEVAGTEHGSYGLLVVSFLEEETLNFTAIDIPFSASTIHEYSIDWSIVAQGGQGISVKVDSNGDGTFEYTFTSDSELTRSEFLIQTGQSVLYTFSMIWGEETFVVSVESNSTVSNFAFSQQDKQISFIVAGEVGIGFCNVTIPKALLYGEPWTLLIDGAALPATITENATHASLYFTYTHSTHTIQMIGTWVIGPSTPPLSVSISPLSASILVGQSVTFTSTVSGGYTPYTYQWYLNSAPFSSATSSTWVFTPTTGGIYYVYLKVTDSKGNTTQSETARITVATVPVGGYSIPIQTLAPANTLTPYLILTAILSLAFTAIKRKTTRKTKQQ